MLVSRIGLTPLKGARHSSCPGVDLTVDGPRGDRVFCLVDPARHRVLRTVEHPRLMSTQARWDDGLLRTRLPSGTVQGRPEPAGHTLKVDYWGRQVALDVVDGPWAAAYSALLGLDVALARSTHPGDVVYGASVTLVTSSSLARLARETGGPVDEAGFRATFTLDTEGEPPHVEDAWVGRRLALGAAEVEVRGTVPRCAVVDLDPRTGRRPTKGSAGLLAALGRYRQAPDGVLFGVDAVVTRPGRVELGARAERS